MSKCAVCVNNVVVNIIIAEPTDACPVENGVLISVDGLDCDIGWVYAGTKFTNPNPPAESDL